MNIRTHHVTRLGTLLAVASLAGLFASCSSEGTHDAPEFAELSAKLEADLLAPEADPGAKGVAAVDPAAEASLDPDDDEDNDPDDIPDCSKDITPPLIECPAPTTYLVGDEVIAAEPLVVDSCDGQPLVEVARYPAVVTEDMDEVAISYAAKDASGNESTCTVHHPVAAKTLTTCSFTSVDAVAELYQPFNATASVVASGCPSCEWQYAVEATRASTSQLAILASVSGLTYPPSTITATHTWTNPVTIGTDWTIRLTVEGYVHTTPGHIRTVTKCSASKPFVVTDTVPEGTYCGHDWTWWQQAINSQTVELKDFSAYGSGVTFNGNAAITPKPYLILGSPNDDNLSGGPYVDCIYGGAGDDVLDGNSSSDEIHGGSGADRIHGGEYSDTLYGEDGSDKIWGDSDNDHLFGGDGEDELHGGDGADDLHGGEGSDTLHGNAGADTLYGDQQNDTLYGDDDSDYLYGGPGDDVLRGNSGNDHLYGEGGNDDLQGDLHADYLSGGDNDDVVSGGDGDDIVYGNAGNDTLHGNADDDILYGGDGNDTLEGDGGNDQLFGENGRDALKGGGGNDLLDGGNDRDKLDGNAGKDTLRGGGDLDLLHGGDGDDTLYGEDWTDLLCGNAGNDTLNGGANPANQGDYCRGGSGNDSFTSCENSLGSTYCGSAYWNNW